MSRNLKRLVRQEASTNIGDFTGLTGASFEEIFSRASKDWKVVLQNDGNGIKFVELVDGKEIEKIRIHGPSSSKHIPENSNSRQGWMLRIQNEKGDYFDNVGNIVPNKYSNEGHIPIKGNKNLGE